MTAAPSASVQASAVPSHAAAGFPVEAFAAIGDEPVSDALAAELQEVLDTSADGDGLTATLITALPCARAGRSTSGTTAR